MKNLKNQIKVKVLGKFSKGVSFMSTGSVKKDLEKLNELKKSKNIHSKD